MKNLIFALTLLCLGLVTQAHYITSVGCGTDGRIKVKGTLFDYAGSQLDSVYLYITTNGQANGPIKWHGSTFIQSGGTFTMDTVPYYTSTGETIFFKEYERSKTTKPFSLEWSGSSYIFGSCKIMPITLTSWTAKIDATDSTLIHLGWSVEMEHNVAYYRIDASVDNGITWDTSIAKLKSLGDTDVKRDYKLDYYNPLIVTIIKTAGFGVFGIVLLIAIFAGSIRNRVLAGVLTCLMIIGAVACRKSVDKPAQHLKYNAVRLTEVDNDGTTKTFEVRALKP